MTKDRALEILNSNQSALRALNHATAILFVDGETVAPVGSAPYRAKTLGELSRMQYELTTDKDAVAALEYLYEIRDTLEPVQKRHISELYRTLDMTRKIPMEESVAFDVLISEASAVWHEAKVNDDFEMFEPYLEKVFAGMIKHAEYFDKEKDPYDVTLDLFERGLTKSKCDSYFTELKNRISPLIKKITSAPQIDDTHIVGLFSIPEQDKISRFCMDLLKIDPKFCTLGETEHPFTANINKYDVRITTHYYENNFLSSLYSVIHEGGHALYELNVADSLVDTCLGSGASMAIHESQSRFYENYIGRSRPFTDLLLGYLKTEFPGRLGDISENDFYRIINKAGPSLIRTEADELTYSMHVMIRYELERMIFDGKITVHDLPKEWNRLYGEYLGVNVPSNKMGVLQDSHWSGGNIGYFPSYSIGSAYGAQYLELMKKEFDPYAAVSAGDLTPINKWLEEKIWRHGCMYDPGDLFASVCGEFNPAVYADYLENKFSTLYNL
ncbi:MAG: carboxypeptidase M32 [Ruminococcaceae bacterium]|nr:carboxypeptidase M32 [Oscillospiraceae bacterium]